MKINPIGLNFGTTRIYKQERNPNLNSNEENLCCYTGFFRYNENDEFILQKLREKDDNRPLRIVSAGCSYGEEVYSFALALNDLKNKPQIFGIDISQNAIQGAKKGVYMLDSVERSFLEENYNGVSHRPMTPFREEIKRRFNQHFKQTNPTTCEYTLKKDEFYNCSFGCANILNIDSMFEENSQDLILCRMVLYHLSDEDKKEFFKKAYKVLKPNGMLALMPLEHYSYEKTLLELGFIQPYKEAKSIFVKPKEDIDVYKYIKDSILNNKSDFNNI